MIYVKDRLDTHCYNASMRKNDVLVRHIALPQDHGSWVFLFSPLLIGLFAGGRWTAASALLITAALAAFLIRQPITVAVKAYSGRRSRRDLLPAWFWLAVYAVFGLLSFAGLVSLGFGYLAALAIPGLPVFAWHLVLVSRRQERRQMWVEVLGTGVLALAAPAAYWVGQGSADPLGWLLLVLAWLQSAASIVYAYLRLTQRSLPALPDPATRLRMGFPALAFSAVNLLCVGMLAMAGWVPALLLLPFALQMAETIWGVTHPAVGVKPTRIGVRQLIVSSLFTVLFILTWG